MQSVEGFRKYLKRKGKKNHVVDDLIRRCDFFEEFLRNKQKTSIDNANKEDILAFLDTMKEQDRNTSNYLRTIGLYFKFMSKAELSALAFDLREQKLSTTRKSLKLGELQNVNKKHIKLLEREGIVTADQMLEKGKNSAQRRELSKKTGIPEKLILVLVKLSDLSRIEGVKSIRARLYYDAGVDTLDKMAKWDADKLRAYLCEFVKKIDFKGMAPLPKEIKNTVETAKKLQRIVDYQE